MCGSSDSAKRTRCTARAPQLHQRTTTTGVPLEIVGRLLGHANVGTTERHYDATVALHFRDQANLVNFEED